MRFKGQNDIAIPVLASLSIAQSAAFYEKLGFDVITFPDYAIARRETLEIHFWLCDDPKVCENTSCYIRVSDVDSLYAEYAANNLTSIKFGAPQEKPWGLKEFYIIDNCGNLLKFGQIIGELLK